MKPTYILRRLLYRGLCMAEKWLPPEGLWFGLRFRMYCKERHGPFQEKFISRIFGDGDISVLSGPFAGMRYYDGTFFGSVIPRWLGCYEEALHPLVREVIERRYETVIDVGSAEGYYAVGFAKALPQSTIYSFDTDTTSRFQQKKIAALNGVSNLKLRSFCDHAFLSSGEAKGKVMLLADIEGWEWKLLDPVKCPALANMDIIAEIHSGFGLTYPEMIEGLSKRFTATHEVSHIVDTAREPSRYGAIVGGRLTESELAEAVDEFRPWQNSWLLFRKRSEAAQPAAT